MATPPRTAQDVIKALNLTPHPEKGYFIETFRDTNTVPPTDTTSSSSAPRAYSTSIYYLLEGAAGTALWHRVRDASETWHHYAGAPLKLALYDADSAADQEAKKPRELVLGKDLWGGERPQVVVRSGEWQSATCLGDWTLVGCTVAPAFVFENFEVLEGGKTPWEG